MEYDHGEGIYSLGQTNGYSFYHLGQENSEELNRFLYSVGFTRRDIFLHQG